MKASPATQSVLDFLHSEKRSHQEQKTWPGVIKVIDRLIACGDSLESAWAELLAACSKIRPHGSEWDSWKFVIDAILRTASFWGPEKIAEIRDKRRRVLELNREIAEKAAAIANLMRLRSTIASQSSINTPDDHYPLNMFERASQLAAWRDADLNGSTLYRDVIKPQLNSLEMRYDYWPSTPDFLDALAEEQFGSDAEPNNGNLAAALLINESSNRDFMRALDNELEDLHRHAGTGEIDLSDASYAAICNAVLGLDGEIEPSNVKAYRADKRKRQRNSNATK